MRKAILAVVLAIVVGAVLAGCGSASTQSTPTATPAATTEQPPVTQVDPPTTTEAPPTPTADLAVASPSDGDTVNNSDNNAVVKGTATPGASVTVDNGDAGSANLTAAGGHWQTSIHLAVGDNNLAVNATKDGFTDAQEVDLTVTRAAPPPMSQAQQNAIRSAQEYLSSQAFSKQGLINQLSSSAGEGFPMADAVFAVNHITVDWNAEAVKSAHEYLQSQAFSRQGLIDQLSSSAGEGFTLEQATYAVNQVYR